MEEKKGFTGRIGFVLAAAGSAVGLGNLWRFPYLAAHYGGGTFLLVYLILAVTFGFALMLTEIAIGRKTGKSALGAFGALNGKYRWIGYVACSVPILIFPYYCVIGGWVIKYVAAFLTGGGLQTTTEGYFDRFLSENWEPVLYLSVFIVLTTGIVMMGVQKGVEKVSKILMPLLILLSVGIAVYGITREGAMAGVVYYLKPDFSKFSAGLLLSALGQLFYSMSLAMGIMITYGSYLGKDTQLESSVRQIEICDTAIAILSGFIIIPAVFAFSGGDESVLSSGPSLMFITLPKVFENMALGDFMGALFFLLVLFAALTSAISMMETLVSFLIEATGMQRIKICILIAGLSWLFALPSVLGFGVWKNIQILGFSILDFLDFLSNSLLMPIVAFLTCIFVGYIIKPKVIVEEVAFSSEFKGAKLYEVIIKYVAPVFILLILGSSVLKGMGVVEF